MRCPRCQHENPDTVKFCGECGARLELRCPSCQAANPPTNKFCHECGAPLSSAEPKVEDRSPRSYTPAHLAEQILGSRAALEGERKQVTVLFADLKGSLDLIADRDPEEATALFDAVLKRMMEGVHRFEGTVNNAMGDGIMALFGAPIAHEDHAVRACYAALSMQEAVRAYAAEVRRAGGVPPQMRVGLNSGEVVVRTIGSDLRMDYNAVGRTTHLAARMEQMATPGSILLSPETLRLVEGYVQVTPLGAMPVKGLAEPPSRFTSLRAPPRLAHDSRPLWSEALPGLSGGIQRWSTYSRPSNGHGRAEGKSSGSSGSPVWERVGSRMSWCTRIGPRGGWSWRVAPSRMGRQRPTSPSWTSSRPTSRSKSARRPSGFARRSPARCSLSMSI